MDTKSQNRIDRMKYLFNPSSVAVIGSSDDKRKPGGTALAALINNKYSGLVYPVNPRPGQVQGIASYPDVLSVPGPVDLAIISVPFRQVVGILRQCAGKNVKSVIVFSSGFAESGDGGKDLQAEISALAKYSGMLICGPNSMGIISTPAGMPANFVIQKLPTGMLTPDCVGIVTQSGGFGISVYEALKELGIGVRYYVSTGNEADLDFSDYLDFMARDPGIKVITGYLEGVRDGGKFARAARIAMENGKPIVLIKVGRHEAAARAAYSHTGSMVGSDRVYSAFFKQHGIIRAENIEDLVTMANILVLKGLPDGNGVVVLSTSGGSGVLLADKCGQYGLRLVDLSERTRKELRGILPEFASALNPVDITSQILTNAVLLEQSLEILTRDPGVDILLTWHWARNTNTAALNRLARLDGKTGKVLFNIVGGPEKLSGKVRNHLQKHHIPTAAGMDVAARALGNLAHYSTCTDKSMPDGHSIIHSGTEKQQAEIIFSSLPAGKILPEHLCKQIFAAYGIPVTREIIAASDEEAADAAQSLGWPVALKIVSPDIPHKSDAGGIKLNVYSTQEARLAYREIIAAVGQKTPGAAIHGILVQEMLPPGLELVLGVTRDDTFGAIVLFGLGGIMVEVLGDYALKVAPVSPAEALKMIREIRGYPLLKGARGMAQVNEIELCEVICGVSRLACDFPRLKELDINPLIVYPGGLKAADGLIHMS